MKIGFIGTGNMASAIIKGIIAKGHTHPSDIYCTDSLGEKLEQFAKETGVNTCSDNSNLVQSVDVVILAIKPHIFPALLPKLRQDFAARTPLIVSIAAGTTLDAVNEYIGADQQLPIIRVMPNVNAMVGAGCAAVCGNQFATNAQMQFILDMFNAVGVAFSIAEKDFSAYTAIAGSSPAFACLFIDALSRGGVKHGIPKDLATQIAAQAVLGSAKMVLEGDDSPWNLIDKVCSPGGTTVAGLLAMEENAFLSTVVKGVDATVEKDRQMMKKQ